MQERLAPFQPGRMRVGYELWHLRNDTVRMFRATAWSNGSPHDSGAGYGLKVSQQDRDRFFDQGWSAIVLHLRGQGPATSQLSASFWRSCTELRSAAIGRWLMGNGLARWPKGNPFGQPAGSRIATHRRQGRQRTYIREPVADTVSPQTLVAASTPRRMSGPWTACAANRRSGAWGYGPARVTRVCRAGWSARCPRGGGAADRGAIPRG